MADSRFRMQVLLPYGFAILCTGMATWIRFLLTPYVGERVPFGCFFVSVLISAWAGGTGPAVLSLVLGMLCAAHFIIPPDATLLVHEVADLFSLAVYFLVGVASIGLFAQLSRRTLEAERQAAENARLTAELKQTDRRKDEFLAVLAHELRNPLAPVRSGVSLLCRMCGHDPRVPDLAAMLNRQLTHLSCIVNDLMDVSRFIRDELTLSCEELDVAAVVQDAVDSVSAEMSQKKHRFTSTIMESDLFVFGDRVRLVQILTNLLLNAAKYTPDGGRIQLFVHASETALQLEVRDNGIGLDPAVQGCVFDPFTQVDSVSTREHGGLGLGLAIVRTLTEKHNGSVAVYSEGRGHGAKFVVELPRLRRISLSSDHDSSPAVRDAVTIAPDCDMGSSTQHMCVYIVDDNSDAAETMAMLLQLDGFQVKCFDDGPSAIQGICQQPPEAIILDIGLPGMDGYEVARRIRSLKFGRGILILACTGWGSAADIQKSKEAGIDHHLVKPVDPPRITALLAESRMTAV